MGEILKFSTFLAPALPFDEGNHELAGTRRVNNASHPLYSVALPTIFFPGIRVLNPWEMVEAVY
jgi:hypothetical protein